MNRIETSLTGAADADGGAAGVSSPFSAEILTEHERIVRVVAGLFPATNACLTLIEAKGSRILARVGPTQDDWRSAGAEAEAALARGEPVFCRDIHHDPRFRPAATAEFSFYAAAPLIGANGGLIGVLCATDPKPRSEPAELARRCLVDLAALAAAEVIKGRELEASRDENRLNLERMGLALGAAGLAGYEWDMTAQPVIATESLRTMVGWDPARGVIERTDVRNMVHPEDRDRVMNEVQVSLAAAGRYAVETRIVRPIDGRVMWIASSGALVADGPGPAHRVIGVIQDITARKIEEEQRETLVAELDHRVKNVLASVQSLAAQSARKASSLEGFLKTFAGRLKSMASAHQLLTATRWRGAGMHNIAAAELGGLAPGQTRWSGPDVLLTPRGANALSLALHELATNAVKFGSLSTEVGRVEVTWWRTDEGGLQLQWLESHGPQVSPPTRRGFGTTLLEKVTGRELGGSVRIDYRPEGVRALLTVGPSAFAVIPSGDQVAKVETPAPSLAGASSGRTGEQRLASVRGLKLLIVEDALLLALELEAGLSEAGADVVGSAADVGEAMRMVDLQIDAAVLDANLNGASVLPVAQALNARGVPFVFATGYGDDKMLPQGFDEAPVIRKPYDVTQVADALSEVTGRARAKAPA